MMSRLALRPRFVLNSGEFHQPYRLAVGIFGCVFQATGSWGRQKRKEVPTDCYKLLTDKDGNQGICDEKSKVTFQTELR